MFSLIFPFHQILSLLTSRKPLLTLFVNEKNFLFSKSVYFSFLQSCTRLQLSTLAPLMDVAHPFLELDPGLEPELSSPLERALVDGMMCAYDIRRFFSFRTVKCPQHFILEKLSLEHFHCLPLTHFVRCTASQSPVQKH